MDLVGTERKKPRVPKPLPAEKVEKTPPVPKIVETVIEENEPVQEEAVVMEEPPVQEEKEPVVHKPVITAIVCELINQELGSVAERFHLKLTDNNLWVLTRAALEEVRPEFAADDEDREEKLERLRPLVIGAMAKVAIKIAAKDRK